VERTAAFLRFLSYGIGAVGAVSVYRMYRPGGLREGLAASVDFASAAIAHPLVPAVAAIAVVAAALARWREGRPDEALSLLYRGALAWLVDRRRLPARESWTEDDCLRHLSGKPEVPLVTASETPREAPLVDYFARLTRAWQRTAYAHRPPSDDEMRELASGWPVHFRAPGPAGAVHFLCQVSRQVAAGTVARHGQAFRIEAERGCIGMDPAPDGQRILMR